MAIVIQFPTALRPYCQGASEIRLTAPNVRDALEQLEQNHPAFYRCICDETGAVRRHLNLFVNDLFLHDQDGLDTVLGPGDVLTIMTAVSGG